MIELEDIVPAAPCEVRMERRGDTFAVKIMGIDGHMFQELNTYTILDGDVLNITGLGFGVKFDGVEWRLPVMKKSECVLPNITLKRKMDIDSGGNNG
jgi:hypothetical protein